MEVKKRWVNVSDLDAFLSVRGRHSCHSATHRRQYVGAGNRITFLIFDPSFLIVRISLYPDPHLEGANVIAIVNAIDICFRFLCHIVSAALWNSLNVTQSLDQYNHLRLFHTLLRAHEWLNERKTHRWLRLIAVTARGCNLTLSFSWKERSIRPFKGVADTS